MKNIYIDGGWNNSFMLMGDIFEHLEKHKCQGRGKKRCWRYQKMCNKFEKLKARGL